MKKTLLEQLYYCDFLPSESIQPSDPDYKSTCQKIDEEITFLSERLSSGDKERLDTLVNLLFDKSCMTDYDNFAYGFRVGAQLILELMAP